MLVVASCAWLAAACAPVTIGDEVAASFAVVDGPDSPVRLAYSEQGRGRPMLLLHGIGTNRYTWRHIAPVLAMTHRVILLDLKGYGRSDKPFDERYSLGDQALLVAEFMRRQRLHDVTLVGHSFGGGIALMLALDSSPDIRRRIARLVLIDTIAYRQDLPVFFELLRTPVVGKVGHAIVPPELQARAALRMAYLDNSKITSRDVAAYARPLHARGAKHALRQTAKQIVPENLVALSERYKTLDKPTLILWCRQDKIVPVAIGKRLHSELPDSDFRVIRDCGHLPQEERPLATVRAVQDFLSRPPRRGDAPLPRSRTR